ncbi:hypothetical protein Acr_10g0003220 [Actinidia rufa]|uniref:Uncharacterized protein n=1 Tax=Actinidia rufa TaxID=165716 RepID=A0A7J0FAL1_9ERIC|nr:hypothetical protein Acr_10g0003220 [Actinidia rufa]
MRCKSGSQRLLRWEAQCIVPTMSPPKGWNSDTAVAMTRTSIIGCNLPSEYQLSYALGAISKNSCPNKLHINSVRLFALQETGKKIWLDLPPPSPSSLPPPATSPLQAYSSPPSIVLAVDSPSPATPSPSISSTNGHSANTDSSAMNLLFYGDGGCVDSCVAATDDVFSAELIWNDGFVESNEPILSPPAEMEVEEGFALRE